MALVPKLEPGLSAPSRPVRGEPEAPSRNFQQSLVDLMPSLRRYALRLCDDASLADDLVQETILKAWIARHRFSPGTNLKAWSATILRNVFFSYKRRSWRTLPLADETLANLPANCTTGSDALDLLALRNAIALLPTDQREALLLLSVGGLSCKEAADICNCAEGTIKSRVSRARLRLTEIQANNKAGYNSDGGLSAASVQDEILAQVAAILARAAERDQQPERGVRPYNPSLTGPRAHC
jgi:RNA polymerase sigma-70 factor (ECF subfamily)